MQTLITEMARYLVEHPERMRVEESTEGGTTVLRLHVDPADFGRVVGRQGRTVRALRKVLSAAERGRGSTVLELVEPEEEEDE